MLSTHFTGLHVHCLQITKYNHQQIHSDVTRTGHLIVISVQTEKEAPPVCVGTFCGALPSPPVPHLSGLTVVYLLCISFHHHIDSHTYHLILVAYNTISAI